MRRARRASVQQWLTWFGVLVLVCAAMLALRGRLDKSHITLALLLVVLLGSAAAGRAVGIALSFTAFLAFDALFLPPYNTLVIADPLDWLALIAFLVTGVTAAELLARERHQADLAERRADEIAALSAERLRLAGAEEEAESLRRADRLKDALLAAVSHDLRTPLTSIKGIANEVWRGGDPERAQVIEEEADRLTSLVDDLLEMSQINAGGMRMVVELNTVDDLIGAALDRVEAAHGADRITVDIVSDGEILVGRFDFAQTMRALTNLLENAVKYSPVGARVLLRAHRVGEVLALVVEDEGPGITAEDLPHIFEPFYRGRGTADGIRGTGLGLSIAKQLAEAQGGSLIYEPRPGGGSRFTLSVPGGTLAEEGGGAPL